MPYYDGVFLANAGEGHDQKLYCNPEQLRLPAVDCRVLMQGHV